MFKKSLLAIVAATALLGFNANSFAYSMCPPGYIALPDYIWGNDGRVHEVYRCEKLDITTLLELLENKLGNK